MKEVQTSSSIYKKEKHQLFKSLIFIGIGVLIILYVALTNGGETTLVKENPLSVPYSVGPTSEPFVSTPTVPIPTN